MFGKRPTIEEDGNSITIRTDDTGALVQEWNRLNHQYRILDEQRDIMNVREQVALRKKMDLIEKACVARHMLAKKTKEAEAGGEIQQLIERFVGTNIKDALNRCDDVALTVLRARLSRLVAPTYRKLSEDILTRMNKLSENIDSEGHGQRESFMDHHVIPFIAEVLNQSICEHLSAPYNIYVSANLRAFFVTPMQMVVKQNFGEDLSRSDAETLCASYRDSYAYEVQELRKGNPALLRDLLYGRGLNQPDSITEEFCEAIAETFSKYCRECPAVAENLLAA